MSEGRGAGHLSASGGLDPTLLHALLELRDGELAQVLLLLDLNHPITRGRLVDALHVFGVLRADEFSAEVAIEVVACEVVAFEVGFF